MSTSLGRTQLVPGLAPARDEVEAAIEAVSVETPRGAGTCPNAELPNAYNSRTQSR